MIKQQHIIRNVENDGYIQVLKFIGKNDGSVWVYFQAEDRAFMRRIVNPSAESIVETLNKEITAEELIGSL